MVDGVRRRRRRRSLDRKFQYPGIRKSATNISPISLHAWREIRWFDDFQTIFQGFTVILGRDSTICQVLRRVWNWISRYNIIFVFFRIGNRYYQKEFCYIVSIQTIFWSKKLRINKIQDICHNKLTIFRLIIQKFNIRFDPKVNKDRIDFLIPFENSPYFPTSSIPSTS